MGSYSQLYLGPVQIASVKNEIDPELMTFFRPSDKRVYDLLGTDPRLQTYVTPDSLAEDEVVTVVEYACPVSTARDRLDLQGFTLHTAREGFRKGIAAELDVYESLIPKLGDDAVSEILHVLRILTPELWLQTMQDLRTNGLLDADESQCETPLQRYMLSTNLYGFPANDPRHYLRMVLEIADEDDELVYDLTHLASSGWVDSASDLVEIATRRIEQAALDIRRILVLTEGKSDKRILESALRLLFPHLADYFHFLDFHNSKAAGGADELAKLVKALAGARLPTRVIALFDNDAEAEEKMRTLKDVELPPTIAVMQYPPLPLAAYYPTLGPSGLASLDVNGLAGSIELYLGRDVLEDDDGSLTPVQWTGYQRQVKKYHGTIVDKDRVLQKGYAKLELCSNDPTKLDALDWTGLKAILNAMLTAFHSVDAEDILASADTFSAYY